MGCVKEDRQRILYQSQSNPSQSHWSNVPKEMGRSYKVIMQRARPWNQTDVGVNSDSMI